MADSSKKLTFFLERVHFAFFLSVAIFTWVFWIDSDVSLEAGKRNIQALHVLWWVVFGMDGLYLIVEILKGFSKPGASGHRVLHAEHDHHSPNHLAKAVRVATSLVVALGILLHWNDFWGLNESDQTLSRFREEWEQSNDLFTVAAYGSLVYIGALFELMTT